MKRQIVSLLITAMLAATLILVSLLPPRSCHLPVLMYHHFAEEVHADTYVTPQKLKEQLTAIKNAGFNTVTLTQMINYVKKGIPLPEKPILITMDDGYTSNLTVAAPILEELNMCATVFVIGVHEGQLADIHSGNPLYPERFSYAEAAVWAEKGVLDIQYHSYDMHRLCDDGSAVRDGMLMKPGENTVQYYEAIENDLNLFIHKREIHMNTPLNALAYPYGYYTEELDHILDKLNIAVTLTVDERCSELRVGDESSLRMLGRYNITEHWSGADLVSYLEGIGEAYK